MTSDLTQQIIQDLELDISIKQINLISLIKVPEMCDGLMGDAEQRIDILKKNFV